MSKKRLVFFMGFLFSTRLCYAYPLLETENFLFSLDSYLRVDFISFKNTVDLDSKNSDDSTAYLGLDYSFGSTLEFKDGGPKFYLKLERNGPFDYSSPIFIHNTLVTSGGAIEKYRQEELLPQIEEFWVDATLTKGLGLKAGLYTYEVGNSFSLHGSYENYSVTLYRELENFIWRLYYCRPELVYKNRLGPRIRQEEEQGIEYNRNSSNFFSTDAKFTFGKNTLWPYIGALIDDTSQGKRDNAFSAPIKRDILGTLGMAWDLKEDKFTFKLEMAHNSGQAQSADPAYKDIQHTGYLIYADLDYNLGKFIPTLSFLAVSGNKVTLEMAQNQDATLLSGKNRAFSCYSPLNKNLGDSISHNHSDIRPMVATGAGYGLNYGVPRPRTFSSTDLDNLIMPSLGFDFNVTPKLCIGLYGYYLAAFTRPVGTLNGTAKYLSRELGFETDLFIDYQFNKNILFNISGGYFLPGKYYKEQRDDTSGSLFSPYLRGDGDINSAYQIEISLELKF